MKASLSDALQRRLESFVAESGLPKEIADELIGHHMMMTYPEGAILFLQGAHRSGFRRYANCSAQLMP